MTLLRIPKKSATPCGRLSFHITLLKNCPKVHTSFWRPNTSLRVHPVYFYASTIFSMKRGDQKLPSYMGIVINHEIRIPLNQPGFNGKYPSFFFRGSPVPWNPTRCLLNARTVAICWMSPNRTGWHLKPRGPLAKNKYSSLPETNSQFAPENGWLEDSFPFGAKS